MTGIGPHGQVIYHSVQLSKIICLTQTKASRVAELTVVIVFAISIKDTEVSKAVHEDYLPKVL